MWVVVKIMIPVWGTLSMGSKKDNFDNPCEILCFALRLPCKRPLWDPLRDALPVKQNSCRCSLQHSLGGALQKCWDSLREEHRKWGGGGMAGWESDYFGRPKRPERNPRLKPVRKLQLVSYF